MKLETQNVGLKIIPALFILQIYFIILVFFFNTVGSKVCAKF